MEHFSSHLPVFVVEELEQRAHLSATLLSAYWPLQGGWEWRYSDVENGKTAFADTQTIMPAKIKVHGQFAYQRLEHDDDGSDDTITLENVSSQGQIQTHRFKSKDFQMTFNPPWVYPKFAQIGQQSSLKGTVDIASGSVHFRGKYSVDMRVVKLERVRVAAGTFSAVKIQQNMSISFGYEAAGVKYSLTSTNKGYQWLAKGVGVIKETGADHSDEVKNGHHQIEDSTFKSALQSFTRPGI